MTDCGLTYEQIRDIVGMVCGTVIVVVIIWKSFR